jgi:hypothetical protein
MAPIMPRIQFYSVWMWFHWTDILHTLRHTSEFYLLKYCTPKGGNSDLNLAAEPNSLLWLILAYVDNDDNDDGDDVDDLWTFHE